MVKPTVLVPVRRPRVASRPITPHTLSAEPVDDNFATIVHAVREVRGILDNIRKFLRYLLAGNMGEVLTVFFGVVVAGVIGLSSGGGAMVLPLTCHTAQAGGPRLAKSGGDCCARG